MSIADKQKAWYYAFITSFWSVAGGLVGYLIGVYLYESVGLWIIELYGMREYFDSLQSWYDEYGIWLIFLAGFLPIPYKVFTIASGVFAFALLPFLIGSIIGRSTRFFIVSGICYWASDSVLRIVEKFNSKVMILVSFSDGDLFCALDSSISCFISCSSYRRCTLWLAAPVPQHLHR